MAFFCRDGLEVLVSVSFVIVCTNVYTIFSALQKARFKKPAFSFFCDEKNNRPIFVKSPSFDRTRFNPWQNLEPYHGPSGVLCLAFEKLQGGQVPV